MQHHTGSFGPVAPPPYDETIVLYMAYHWLHCYPAMTVLPLTTATRLELRSAHSPPSLIPRPPAPGLDHLQYAKNIVQAIQNWNWGRFKLSQVPFLPRIRHHLCACRPRQEVRSLCIMMDRAILHCSPTCHKEIVLQSSFLKSSSKLFQEVGKAQMKVEYTHCAITSG